MLYAKEKAGFSLYRNILRLYVPVAFFIARGVHRLLGIAGKTNGEKTQSTVTLCSEHSYVFIHSSMSVSGGKHQ